MKISTIILIVSLLAVSYCQAQKNLLKNHDFNQIEKGCPKDWTWVSGGCGKFKLINDPVANVIQIKVAKNNEKGSAILLAGGWKPNNMLVLKNDSPLFACLEARGNTPDSVAHLVCTFRDRNNRWLGQVVSDDAKLGKNWEKLTVKAIPPRKAYYVQFSASACSGTVQFRKPVLKEAEFTPDENESSNKPEFWLNVDYGDEVMYCDKVGYTTYGKEEIAKLFQLCAQNNVYGVLWRVSNLGTYMYHTKAGTMYPGRIDPGKLSDKQKLKCSILKEIDPLKVAISEARKNNIKIMIWVTIADEYGTNVKNETYSTNSLVLDHPEYSLLDKNGKPMKGSLCFNVPAVRKYRLDIIKELLDYKADGIYFCTRTHAFYYGKDPDYKYGYNKEIVEEYRKRYGKDILKDDFDKEKWLALRAEGLDSFFEEACSMVHQAGQKTMLSIKTAAHENRGWPWGKAKMNWKKWVKNGWIDDVVIGHYFIPMPLIIKDTKSFRKIANKDQKVFFWMQLWHYQKRFQTPLAELIKQLKLVRFAGADGVVCHEAIGLEERIKSYWLPLGKAIEKYWNNGKKGSE